MQQSQKIVSAAEAYAESHGAGRIEPIRNSRVRKEELARRRLRERGIESGLVGVWSALESCWSYRACFSKLPRQNRYRLSAKGQQLVMALDAMLDADTESLMEMAA